MPYIVLTDQEQQELETIVAECTQKAQEMLEPLSAYFESDDLSFLQEFFPAYARALAKSSIELRGVLSQFKDNGLGTEEGVSEALDYILRQVWGELAAGGPAYERHVRLGKIFEPHERFIIESRSALMKSFLEERGFEPRFTPVPRGEADPSHVAVMSELDQAIEAAGLRDDENLLYKIVGELSTLVTDHFAPRDS